MSGVFTPSSLPDLPGAYTRYTALVEAAVAPSPGSTVAIAVTHDWGPDNTPVLLPGFSDFENVYGSDVTPARIAVWQAFFGEGLDGWGGAGGVLLNRMTSATAAAATADLNNPAAAPAIRITAKYKGTRGDRLNVTVTPALAGQQFVEVLDGTAVLESYTLNVADTGALGELVSEINTVSEWVDAVLLLEGATGLATATTPLAGGNDGDVLSGADWLNGANVFNDSDFAYFAPFDLPYAQGTGGDAVRTTVASLVAWRQDQEKAGHRFSMVTGGVLDEMPADAVLRAKALYDPGTLTVGGPGVDDDQFGALSSSQLAPRIAGIRAQRGETMNMHFARLAGTTIRPKPDGTAITLTEKENMVGAGVVALERDRYSVAPTRIVKDVNTWAPDPRTQAADELAQPKKLYGNPKFVQTMQQFANDAEAEVEQELIGKVTVNQQSRDAAAARVLRLAQDRIKIGALQPGANIVPEPGSDSDEFIKLKADLPFGRALAQLFIEGTVR